MNAGTETCMKWEQQMKMDLKLFRTDMIVKYNKLVIGKLKTEQAVWSKRL